MLREQHKHSINAIFELWHSCLAALCGAYDNKRTQYTLEQGLALFSQQFSEAIPGYFIGT